MKLGNIWKHLKTQIRRWWHGLWGRSRTRHVTLPLPLPAEPLVSRASPMPGAAAEPISDPNAKPVVPITPHTTADAHPAPPLAPEPVVVPSPRREQWRAGHFECAEGTVGYRLYRPPELPDAAKAVLVVMLHGCRQNADDFARGTAFNALAREAGVWVLYPQQSERANPYLCWNWFEPGHQRRERGEPAVLAALTRQVVTEEGLNPARVAVAGLSAGGAMAALLGQTHPDVFGAVGVHSGLAPGAARNMFAAIGAMKRGSASELPAAPWSRPLVVFHGDADTVVHPDNAEFLLASVFGGTPPLARVHSGHGWTQRAWPATERHPAVECWRVHGAGHAWSGGDPAGSFADASGPSASREMLRFFREQLIGPQAVAAGERDKFHGN